MQRTQAHGSRSPDRLVAIRRLPPQYYLRHTKFDTTLVLRPKRASSKKNTLRSGFFSVFAFRRFRVFFILFLFLFVCHDMCGAGSLKSDLHLCQIHGHGRLTDLHIIYSFYLILSSILVNLDWLSAVSSLKRAMPFSSMSVPFSST